MGRGGSRNPADYRTFRPSVIRDNPDDYQLNRGERVLMEGLLLAVPLGSLIRGGRAVNYAIKGARPIRYATASGTRKKMYYDTGRKRIISRRDYRNRAGLYEKMRNPDRAGRILYKKADRQLRSGRFTGPVMRGYDKATRLEMLVNRGPLYYLAYKYMPRAVRTGMAVGAFYLFVRDLIKSPGSSEPVKEPETPSGPRVEYDPGPRELIVFNRLGRSPPTLGRVLQKKIGSRTSSKSKKHRCPPGHRWSSRLRKCVRVNGRRA